MNYGQYIAINEEVDEITLTNNKKLSYITDKQAVTFFCLPGCYVFGCIDKTVATIVVSENNKEMLMFTAPNETSNLIHEDIVILVMELVRCVEDIRDIGIQIKSNNVENLDDYANDLWHELCHTDTMKTTGRIFTSGKTVAVRGDEISPILIKNAFNSISSAINKPKINDSWIFEKSIYSGGYYPSEIKKYYYNDLSKEIQKSS